MQYVKLVGAQFKSHGTGTFSTNIEKPEHPIMKSFKGFETWDETYVHHKGTKDRNVLQTREGEPWTWTREPGKGRVFYTAYGHDQRTWWFGSPDRVIDSTQQGRTEEMCSALTALLQTTNASS